MTSILGDPGAVSRAGLKGATKGRKTFVAPFLPARLTAPGSPRMDDKGWGDGSPLTPLVGLNRESMESNLTHLRLPGLNIGDGQHTTHALGRNLTFRASL